MAKDGVILHGKVLGLEGECFQLADDLAETLDVVDQFCENQLEGIDELIRENQLDDPPEEILNVNWQPGPQSSKFDLLETGVSTVIYATGFHFDFSWIDLPIFDERGYPRYSRGITDIPGFYFCGLHWMHTQGSGLFYGVGDDAEYVVSHLVAR